MGLSLRKPSDDGDGETPQAVTAVAQIRGKGRPTPKRRDTVPVRGPVAAPKTRKEAYARQKQVNRDAKAGRASGRPSPAALNAKTPAERRAAIRSGEILSARDQGVERALARDYVDSHRMFSNFLFIVIVLMLGAMFARGAWILQLVAFVMFIGMIVEWVITGRKVRNLAIQRFGQSRASALSLGFYAGSRAYLPRKWRIPLPRVEQGDPI